MNVSLPTPPDRWTPEWQARYNLALEQAFQRIWEYARIPPGGTTGQALQKNSARDFDLKWV